MKYIIKRLLTSLILVFILTLSMQYIIPSSQFIKEVEAATVKLNKKEITINVDETYQLEVSGTKSKVTWSSSKKSIATVSSKGLVRGKKAGSIFVTAKVGNKEFTCRVNVVVPSISYKKTENGIGGITQYLIINLPKRYKKDDVSWASSNNNVFTVNESGLVTNIGLGKAKLIATFGTYKLTKTIYVNATKKNLEEAVNYFEIEYLESDQRIVAIITNKSKINIFARYQLEFYDTDDNLVSISSPSYLQAFINDECFNAYSIPEKEYKYYKIKFDDINEFNYQTNIKDKVDVEASELYDYEYNYIEWINNHSIEYSDTVKLFDLNVNNRSKNRAILEAYVIFYNGYDIVDIKAFESYGNIDVGTSVIKSPYKPFLGSKIIVPEYDSYRIIYTAKTLN